MSYAFTKLFSTILQSTIWTESLSTKVVWVTMLALADRKGRVMASIPGLARTAGVTIEECETAIACFLGPDRYSRTKANEGRRVSEMQGGWVLLNYEEYRKLQDEETIRESKRQWAERNRKKSNGVEPVEVDRALSIQAEAEAEAEAVTTTPKPLRAISLRSSHPVGFLLFWKSWPSSPRKVGKAACAKKWRQGGLEEMAPEIAAHVRAMAGSKQWQTDGFEPAPLTYLNQRRWEDGAPMERESDNGGLSKVLVV
jgi:hypothetical protein